MPILLKTGHEQQIGDKFTKYTKNGAFGFFNGHYFFIDHELVTPCLIPRF